MELEQVNCILDDAKITLEDNQKLENYIRRLKNLETLNELD